MTDAEITAACLRNLLDPSEDIRTVEEKIADLSVQIRFLERPDLAAWAQRLLNLRCKQLAALGVEC